MPSRRSRFEIGLAATGLLFAGLVASSSLSTGDYSPHEAVIGDSNAAPAILALVHGDLHAFVTQQPVMGLVSLILRAPAVALTQLTGAGDRAGYRLGFLTCLLPILALIVWVSRARPLTARWKLTCVLTCLLLLAGPATVDAVQAGHPEGELAAVASVAAVIAAQRGREVWAGLALGLAVGSKEWGVLAAVPVLMALPGGRSRCLLTAAGITLVASAAALGEPATFLARAHAITGEDLANPYSAWWATGTQLPVTQLPVRVLPLGLTRSMALGSVLAVGSLLGLGAWLRRGAKPERVDPLAVLAGLMLLRAVADPHPLEYYYVPFLMACAVWEAYALGRPPITAALAAALLLVTFALPLDQPAWPNAVLLAGSGAVLAYLVRRAFPARPAREVRGVHSRGVIFNPTARGVDLEMEHA